MDVVDAQDVTTCVVRMDEDVLGLRAAMLGQLARYAVCQRGKKGSVHV